MEKKIKHFTMEEVEALVKNAYEVGYCDGVDGDGDYNPDSDGFWNKNIEAWMNSEITYITKTT